MNCRVENTPCTINYRHSIELPIPHDIWRNYSVHFFTHNIKHDTLRVTTKVMTHDVWVTHFNTTTTACSAWRTEDTHDVPLHCCNDLSMNDSHVPLLYDNFPEIEKHSFIWVVNGGYSSSWTVTSHCKVSTSARHLRDHFAHTCVCDVFITYNSFSAAQGVHTLNL